MPPSNPPPPLTPRPPRQLRYVDDEAEVTSAYPFCPNGSPDGIAAMCSADGRHLAMMPHPERCFLTWQWPYMPDDLKAQCTNGHRYEFPKKYVLAFAPIPNLQSAPIAPLNSNQIPSRPTLLVARGFSCSPTRAASARRPRLPSRLRCRRSRRTRAPDGSWLALTSSRSGSGAGSKRSTNRMSNGLPTVNREPCSFLFVSFSFLFPLSPPPPSTFPIALAFDLHWAPLTGAAPLQRVCA